MQKVKNEGYVGVEMGFPLDENERNSLVKHLKKHQLKWIAQHWETIDCDFEIHKLNYEKSLRNLAATKPIFINSQTGKDYYSFQQNSILIAIADQIEIETGIKILHETHRGKFSFAAHVTQNYLTQLPDLKLCLDISHWCCVAETFLEDQKEAVHLAISKTHHIHSRVGFTQGPQVMDPRAPENQEIVDTHIVWWQQVIDSIKIKGGNNLTITTEFGAPPYQQLLPNTQEPIYNLWDVNIYMMKLLKDKLKV